MDGKATIEVVQPFVTICELVIGGFEGKHGRRKETLSEKFAPLNSTLLQSRA